MNFKTLYRIGTLGLLGTILLAGCGTVRPAKDFASAGSLIKGRTGAQEVYDPESEAAIAQRVDQLLTDGVTADEAVQIALLNNKEFQSRFQEIAVSKADLVQSALLSNPTLSFSARFPEGGGRANLGFGLAQEIADIWQIPVRKRIARDQLDRTIFGVVTFAIDLSTRTRKAYYHLLELQETEKIVAANAQLLKHSQELAEHRFQAGESSVLDVNLIRSNVFEANMRLETVRGDTHIARAEFEHLLGLSAGQTGFALTDVLNADAIPEAEEAARIQQALANRIDIQIAAADIDGAEAELKRQHRGVIPSVVVGLDGERPEARAPRSLKPIPSAPPRPDLSGVTASQSLNEAITQLASANRAQGQALSQSVRDLFTQQLDEWRGRRLEKRQTIDLMMGPSFQISLPIWDQNRAQIAKAQYAFVQKQKDYAELVLSVIQDVRQAAATLQTTQDLLRISREQALPLAEQNVGTAERVYEAGEENVLALLLAQQDLNAQREANIKLRAEYAAATADLERALGGQPAAPDARATAKP